MGYFNLYIKKRLKKPLITFAVIILILTMGISCATTSDEEISGNEVIEETDDEAVIEGQGEKLEQEENDKDEVFIEVNEELIKVESNPEKGVTTHPQ